LRLWCLCLATFFLVHLAVGLLVLAMSPSVARGVEGMASRSAARWLLALRLAPLACALFVVAALCVPSYLWWEPEAAPEQVGFACLASALLGATVWGLSIVRGARAVARSLEYIERCQRGALGLRLAGHCGKVWVTDGETGSLMLGGIVRPRIFVSRRAMTALSSEQLEVAVRHESAHRVSGDNWKRLLMQLAPGILPFFRGFEPLEAHWGRLAEWAADDRAVEGDSNRSLSLAAALVRVARLTPASYRSPLITSLLDDGRDLAARVDRLLRVPPVSQKSDGRILLAVGSLVLAGLLLAVMLRPATLHSVHRLLEELIH
jgi:Zn-dependent protease with chaperone function